VPLLLAAVAPAAFMLHFIYVRDKYEREPLRRVLGVYFLSFLTVIPAAVLENLVVLPKATTLSAVAIEVWLVVALTEEVVKYLALRYWAMPRKEFNEVYDGILYAVAASLGFATAENLLYVFGDGGGWGTAAMRAVLSVPAHALWGVITGYFAGLAWFAPKRFKLILVWCGLLLAIFWHGLYDFFAFGAGIADENTGTLMLLGLPATVAANWVLALILVKRAQSQSVFKRPSPMLNPLAAVQRSVKFCHRCGLKLPATAGFCTRCGYSFHA
jgi:protease PrsW